MIVERIFDFASKYAIHSAVLLGAALKPREISCHIKNSGIKKVMTASKLPEVKQESQSRKFQF